MEMRKEKFLRSCGVIINNDEIDLDHSIKPVWEYYQVISEGYPYSVNGYTIYVSNENGYWDATEAASGFILSNGCYKTKKELEAFIYGEKVSHILETKGEMIVEQKAIREKRPIVTKEEWHEIWKRYNKAE